MLYCVAGTFRRLSRLFFFSSSPLSERLSSSIPVVELSSRLLARNNPSQLPKGRRRRLFVKVGAVHLQQVSGLEWLLAEFARQRYSAFHRLLLVGVAKLSGIFCSVDCFAFDPGLLLFLLLLQCWRMIAIGYEDDSDGCSGIDPIPCFLNLWVRKKNLLQNSLQRISQNAFRVDEIHLAETLRREQLLLWLLLLGSVGRRRRRRARRYSLVMTPPSEWKPATRTR